MLENDEDDQYITTQYFRDDHPDIEVKIVSTSDEVISYLEQARRGIARSPSLFLFNYHSTPLNAAELLQQIKKDKAFSHIPAVVLSGIHIATVVKDCYSAGASSFILKPVMMADTNKKISTFIEYWFRTVELT
jgi:response regulator RpfG family c-di-GMP phosphodiesterase